MYVEVTGEGECRLYVKAGGKFVKSERNADTACTWRMLVGSSNSGGLRVQHFEMCSHTDDCEVCYSETWEENIFYTV